MSVTRLAKVYIYIKKKLSFVTEEHQILELAIKLQILFSLLSYKAKLNHRCRDKS